MQHGLLRMRIWAGVIVGVAAAVVVFDAHAGTVDHGVFDRLLARWVKRGRVDYAGLKRQRAELATYLEAVARADISGLKRNALLAFYLNAYNARVLQAVVEKYPEVRSVKSLNGFFDKTTFRVAGRSLTLNALENDIIRPTFQDPRTHFILVCAARSCPPLKSRALRAATVQRVLEACTRKFINSKTGVQKSKDGYKISQIFKWYADDFKRSAGSVGKFLSKYHKRYGKKLAMTDQFDYLPYSWALNKR